MLLSKLLNDAFLDCDIYGSDISIEGITASSLKVKKNYLYIAIEGLHTDGHKFVCDAAEQGAVAAVVSRKAIRDGKVCSGCHRITMVAVDDCRDAMAKIFASFYGNPQNKMKFIGVTGTNGKTSVCRMIYEILCRSGKKCGIIGTVGSFIGSEKLEVRPLDENANMTTPDPEELYRILYIMQNAGAEYVVMEVTSHSLALSKVSPIKFDVGVFTNLTEDHLDFHSDMEDYFVTKEKLFSLCSRAVINCDDKYGRRLAEKLEIPVFTCSADGRISDFLATDIHYKNQNGIEYKLSSPRLRLRLRSPLAGRFNVMNTMQAAVSAFCAGIPAHEIKETIANFGGIEGRLEKLKINGRAEFSVYLDYAHTPDALENLLSTARSFSNQGQRLVLVFGCGGDRDKQKRAIMGKIAASMADFVIVTSDNSRSEKPSDIIRDIVSGIKDEGIFTVIEDRREAIEFALKNARRQDIIILAGKGHEEYEIDANGRKPFSEKEIVRSFVERYYS